MKVIDLLNKIANGVEVPKYVKYINHTSLDTEDTMMVCKENIFYKLDNLEINLNDEVEIIEEPQEHKIPEKFKVHSWGDKDEYGNYVDSPFPTEKELMDKINEILEYLEEIK